MPRLLTDNVREILSNKEELIDMHINKLFSIVYISNELNVTPGVIRKALKSHGIESPSYQKLREAANLRKYGVANASHIPGSRDKAMITTIGKYGGKSWKSDIHKFKKHTEDMMVKYGAIHPSALPVYREKRLNTCIKKYNRPYAKQVIIPDNVYKLLSTREWIYNEYIVCNKSISQICLDLSISWRSVHTFLKYHNIEIKRSRLSLNALSLINDKDWLIEQLYTFNKTLTDIASELSITYQPISKKCKEFNIVIPVHSSFYLPDQRTLLMNKQWMHDQLAVKERSFSHIAKQFATSASTIKKWYVYHGIDISTYKNSKHPVHIVNKLNDKNWLIDHHLTQEKSLLQIAGELGLCNNTPTNSGALSAALKRHNMSVKYYKHSMAEKEIGGFLTNCNVCYYINTRTIINPYELDIYIPDHKIAIEYCGLYWHSNKFKLPDYHKVKYNKCKEIGIRLITIFEDEWIHNSELVKRKIAHLLKISSDTKTYARKCKITILTTAQKTKFFNDYHIQGSGPGSITYGLINEVDQIVAAISFIEKSNNNYVLNRYATSCIVPGGFSKLLQYFKNNISNWNTIVTFADLRWSNGSLYEKHHFILDSIIPPDYKYIVGDHTVHKFNFRHSRLSKILSNYDKSKSEWDNMQQHGYLKIVDCGKQKYILRNINLINTLL